MSGGEVLTRRDETKDGRCSACRRHEALIRWLDRRLSPSPCCNWAEARVPMPSPAKPGLMRSPAEGGGTPVCGAASQRSVASRPHLVHAPKCSNAHARRRPIAKAGMRKRTGRAKAMLGRNLGSGERGASSPGPWFRLTASTHLWPTARSSGGERKVRRTIARCAHEYT